MRDAFEAIRRKLATVIEKQHGQIKVRSQPSLGARSNPQSS
jgi:hypothetical protein